MPHKKRLIDSSNPIHWQWPVRVGFVTARKTTVKNRFRGFWSNKLSIFVPVSLNPRKSPWINLLIVETIEEAVRIYKMKKFSDKGKPSVIIVFGRSDYFISEKDKHLGIELRRVSGAAGIFFSTSQLKLSEWYEEFIMQLSHNMGVGEALRSIPGTKIRSFELRGLNESTRLSNYILRVSDSLRLSGNRANLPESVKRLWTTDKINTSAELARFLIENVKKLPYDHESETASKVRKTVEAMQKAGMKTPAISKVSTGRAEPSRGLPVKKKVVKKLAKKSAAKKAVKKAAPKKKVAKSVRIKKQTATTIPPRYLQATFQKRGSKAESVSFLEPATAYQLKVRIGEKEISLLTAGEEVPLSEAFEDPKTKLISINLEIRTNLSAKALYGSIRLPRVGSSNFVNFLIDTGKKNKLFKAEIYAFYKERLLQKSVITIEIRTKDDLSGFKTPTFKTEAVLRKSLNNLEKRQQFSASLVIPDAPSKTQKMVGRSKTKPVGLKFTPSMAAFVKNLRDAIQQIALTDDSKDLSDPANVALLRGLANQGSILHRIYLRSMVLDGPLQLVNNMRDFLPLDFAYTLLPPEPGATLCKHAKEALEAGACKNCISSKEMQRKNICPFGFWGLSQVIERHQYPPQADSTGSDYELRFEPFSAERQGVLKVLDRTLHASTDRVNGIQRGLSKKITDKIKLHCKKSTEAKSWDQWKNLVPTSNPESLVLVVHVEPGQPPNVSSLEIGKAGTLLEQTQFDERYINTEKKKVTPFVILIGCETTNTDAYMFDTVSQLLMKGAAIVLSNFTEILGSQAAQIIMHLIELLKKEAATEISFGEVVLKLRQQMLARGLLVSLTLLAHGDADWKIKT